MLQSYTLEGFKSIKQRTEVDLRKTQYQILENTNVDQGVLKGCMFVGGNASGKTNLLDGIFLLIEALFSNKNIDWKSYCCLFADSKNFTNSYVFLIDGKNIEYQIGYYAEEEALIEKLLVNNATVIERMGNTAKSKISERQLFNDIPGDSVFLRDLWFNTRFRGEPLLQKWFAFLSESKYVNPQWHMIVGNDVRERFSIDKYLKENGVDELNSFLDECGFDYSLSYRPNEIDDGTPFSGLYVRRRGIQPDIPMAIESLGNKHLMNILPSYLSVVKNSGMLICDEFSSGLHNDLEELLIKYFMRHSQNSQIFIVSHSTNLLSSSLLRPDQLYAVNFDCNGTNIVRFSSEQPRTGQNYEKMYLGGVFSGLPKYNEI